MHIQDVKKRLNHLFNRFKQNIAIYYRLIQHFPPSVDDMLGRLVEDAVSLEDNQPVLNRARLVEHSFEARSTYFE